MSQFLGLQFKEDIYFFEMHRDVHYEMLGPALTVLWIHDVVKFLKFWLGAKFDVTIVVNVLCYAAVADLLVMFG